MPEKIGPQIRALKPFGVWFGRRHVYLPKLLRPDAAALLTLLWGVWTKKSPPPSPPAPGLTSFALDGTDTAPLQAGGFSAVGPRAIRFDMLERLEDALEKALSSGGDAGTLLTAVTSLLGAGKDEARAVLVALGWREVAVDGAQPVWRRIREKSKPRIQKRPPEKPSRPVDPNSPFAALAAFRSR